MLHYKEFNLEYLFGIFQCMVCRAGISISEQYYIVGSILKAIALLTVLLYDMICLHCTYKHFYQQLSVV